jgi:hypothetical protein
MRSAGRTSAMLAASLFVALGHALAVETRSDGQVLLTAYLHLGLTEQVMSQSTGLAAGASAENRRQVAQATAGWAASSREKTRRELEERFGAEARSRFEAFFAELSAAEGRTDAAYLKTLAGVAGIEPPPADYAAMRALAATTWMAEDVNAAATFMGEIQTWLDVKNREPNTPPLDIWLSRTGSPAASPPKPAKKPRNPLAEAEAPAQEFQPDEGSPAANPLVAYDSMRRERRDRKLVEAQAGMQQVSVERDAAEQDLAARKTTAAQADADAMRRQAERLAATEVKAMEQRKNSWSNRMKSIFTMTVGAATSTFTGGIGAQAGQKAAEAIFPPR